MWTALAELHQARTGDQRSVSKRQARGASGQVEELSPTANRRGQHQENYPASGKGHNHQGETKEAPKENCQQPTSGSTFGLQYSSPGEGGDKRTRKTTRFTGRDSTNSFQPTSGGTPSSFANSNQPGKRTRRTTNPSCGTSDNPKSHRRACPRAEEQETQGIQQR